MELAKEVLRLVDEHDAFPRVGVAATEDAYDDVHGLDVDLDLGHRTPRDAEEVVCEAYHLPNTLGVAHGAPIHGPACIHTRCAQSWS